MTDLVPIAPVARVRERCCTAHHFEGCTDGGPGCCPECPINPWPAEWQCPRCHVWFLDGLRRGHTCPPF